MIDHFKIKIIYNTTPTLTLQYHRLDPKHVNIYSDKFFLYLHMICYHMLVYIYIYTYYVLHVLHAYMIFLLYTCASGNKHTTTTVPVHIQHVGSDIIFKVSKRSPEQGTAKQASANS